MSNDTVRKAACVGAGVIGTGWATAFAIKGLPVGVHDIDHQCLAKSEALFGANIDFLRNHDVLTEAEASVALAKVSFTTSLDEATDGADFIQESCPENCAIKVRTLAEIEARVSSDSIIATSTSGLLVTEIAKGAIHPERVVGGHPYNPTHIMPLVEIMRGEKTSDETVARAARFYADMGKEPIVLRKEIVGYISNRLQLALYREAIDLVVRGVCSVEDVDKATVYGLGLRYAALGPNLLYHLGAGERGIKRFLTSLGESSAARLRDLAVWAEEPEDWPRIAEEGVVEELRHRSPREGQTIQELVRYRDDVLIALQKHHRKV